MLLSSDDRTAFAAVIRVQLGGSARVIGIGIGTKYHEYPITEPVNTRRRDVERVRTPKQQYLDVTEHSQLFTDEHWLQHVWGTDVEQICRDHLLALACQQESAEITAVRYVLLAPAGNPAWSRLGESYARMLANSARPTFEFRTIDDLLDLATDLLPHASDFRARYLEVSGDDPPATDQRSSPRRSLDTPLSTTNTSRAILPNTAVAAANRRPNCAPDAPTGPVTPAGPLPPTGPTGPTGPAGPAGPAGPELDNS